MATAGWGVKEPGTVRRVRFGTTARPCRSGAGVGRSGGTRPPAGSGTAIFVLHDPQTTACGGGTSGSWMRPEHTRQTTAGTAGTPGRPEYNPAATATRAPGGAALLDPRGG